MTTRILHQLYRQRRLWRGSHAPAAAEGIETGFAALDAMLPQRGWPRGAVVEVSVTDWGIGEMSLLLPLMAHYQRRGECVTWIAPPHMPYPPALAAAGLDPAYCRVLANPSAERDVLWCAEKLAQSGAGGLILAWPRSLTGQSVRRLQLALENSEALCLLWRRQGPAMERVWDGRPAALRLGLSPAGAGLRLEVLKARGTCRQSSLVLAV